MLPLPLDLLQPLSYSYVYQEKSGFQQGGKTVELPFAGIDVVTLIITLFWVWMMIDSLLSRKISGGTKLFWFILILLTHIVGAIIYYFVACEHRNPFDAFTGYYRTVTQPFQQSTPPSAQPRQPTPPPPYPEYRQGYQAQQQERAPVAPTGEPEPYYSPSPYEQPTVSYPELPPQQQQ
jgi:Phospholipase_D-nuclease N-terminal